MGATKLAIPFRFKNGGGLWSDADGMYPRCADLALATAADLEAASL